MKFEQLLKNHDVKLVLLKDKTRLTKKGIYCAFNIDGELILPVAAKKYEDVYTDVGILCQYIDDLGLYLCALDIDTKDFPVTKILSKYPTSIVETNHGYHLYYLSPCPVRYKQLSGQDKEICKVDIRGQRDETHEKEGNYVRYYPGAVGNILECDFNDVISYCYSLFGIEARSINEYSGNIKQAEIIRQNNRPKNNTEMFLAYYLYYQKNDWGSAYTTAFPWGLRLAGWLDSKAMQRVAYKLMNISDYYGKRKWILAFLSGYETGTKGRPHLGDETLKPEFQPIFKERFEQLNEKEIETLAKYCKNVRLYEILKIIGDKNNEY